MIENFKAKIIVERVAWLQPLLRNFVKNSKVLLPILAGSASAVAFIYSQPLLLAFSYFIFILSLFNKPVRVADRVGLVFGLSQFFIGLFWFFQVKDPYLANSNLILQGFGFLAIFLMSMLFAFFSIFVTLVPVHKRNNIAWFAFLVPSSLALMEWVKTIYFTGFPWFQASHIFSGDMFSGWFAIFGEIGVSFLFYFFVSLSCYIAISDNKKQKFKRYLMLLLLFGVMTVLLGKIDFSLQQLKENKKNESSTVLVINGDSDLREKEVYESRIQRVLRYQEMVLALDDITFSIWPESSSGTGVYHDILNDVSEGFSLLEKNKTRVFFGGYAQQGMFVKNSIFSSKQEKGLYTKQHLAPIGEYIPMWFTLFDVWIPGAYQGSTVTDNSTNSDENNLLVYDDVKMTPIICYEVLFNNEVRERSKASNVLVTFSDLGAIKYSWVKEYFFNLSRIRAMELQKPILVSSNKGISGIITKKGVVAQKKQGAEGFILGEIRSAKTLTPFSYFGNNLILVVLVLMLLVGMGAIVYPAMKQR